MFVDDAFFLITDRACPKHGTNVASEFSQNCRHKENREEGDARSFHTFTIISLLVTMVHDGYCAADCGIAQRAQGVLKKYGSSVL